MRYTTYWFEVLSLAQIGVHV